MGLLMMAGSQWTGTNRRSYMYDGNGNVTEVVDGNGAVVAHYEYDPYGNVRSRSGAVATNNPFRFSTKYADEETDLVYYGYRYYSPELGRWVSRDPVGEYGGCNLYGFLWNTPVNVVDTYGLWLWDADYDLETPDGKHRVVVKKCNIVIYRGDASLLPNIGNEKCSAASTVSCDPEVYRPEGPITIAIPLPGWEPIRQPPPLKDKPTRAYEGLKTDDTVSPADAIKLVDRDFETAKDYAANNICKSAEKCCEEVNIEVSCEFLAPHMRLTMPSGVCGKREIVKCQ